MPCQIQHKKPKAKIAPNTPSIALIVNPLIDNIFLCKNILKLKGSFFLEKKSNNKDNVTTKGKTIKLPKTNNVQPIAKIIWTAINIITIIMF